MSSSTVDTNTSGYIIYGKKINWSRISTLDFRREGEKEIKDVRSHMAGTSITNQNYIKDGWKRGNCKMFEIVCVRVGFWGYKTSTYYGQ